VTRINVVAPSMLSDKHLGAEYRELPRVFGLVRQAIARGELPTDTRNPTTYILGKGHVRFFYPRLAFILKRHVEICDECRSRGRLVSFRDVDDLVAGLPTEWWGHWEPTPEAIELNIQRINDKGGLRHANNP
jgi:deoxyribonuclease (pyrimidine dimer)